jgi:hypothetical protein
MYEAGCGKAFLFAAEGKMLAEVVGCAGILKAIGCV